jgi:aspartate aminotransferase-like enzyme
MYNRKAEGTLRVSTRVKIVDIFGHEVERPVRVGTMHYVDSYKAVEVVESARKANPTLGIKATLSIDL